VSERLYFRRLLSGRDFATSDPIAAQMVNFTYLVGDRTTGEAVVVDPAYAVQEIVDAAAGDGMRIVGALATHYHADHVGGSMMGHSVEGVAQLIETEHVPVHVQRAEAPWIMRTTGLAEGDLRIHDAGDTLRLGEIEIEFVHTPGHTPGSQCFLVQDRLVAGDTLFLDGCGRTDLPGADPEQMYESLARLARLPDDTIVYPGHRYSLPSSGTIAAIRESNMVYRPKSKEAWLMMFSH
jgi:glyoxylase-like metal-dependent hydrolase (beta-lactamase superfamily II)